jgi:hypothetical protein
MQPPFWDKSKGEKCVECGKFIEKNRLVMRDNLGRAHCEFCISASGEEDDE